MPIFTFRRCEKKMLIDLGDLPAFRKDISEHFEADQYCLDGKSYPIGNLYFDSPDLDLIRRSVDKPVFKEKVRLRSYGTPDASSRVFLEAKRKCEGVGTKRRVAMTLAEAERFVTEQTLPGNLSPTDRQILGEISFLFRQYDLRPIAYIGCMREAYFDREDPTVRLTIDTDILSRRDGLDLSKGHYGTPLLPPGKALAEIKFSRAVPLWFARLMSRYKLSFCSFSKYGTDFNIRNQSKNTAKLQPAQEQTIQESEKSGENVYVLG